MTAPVEVVVVGAGLSGLVAAHELRRRGVQVEVWESADRVGGRSLSETSALGSRLDLGGQWIGHDHHRVGALVSDLGLTAFPMTTVPLATLVDGPRRIRPWSPSVLTAVVVLVAVELLSRLRPRSRWNTVSVATWLRRVPGRTTRRLLEVTALISWTADLDRVSVRTMTRLVRAQHGVLTMLTTRGGAQDSLVVEGAGTIAERLAADLGDAVHTGRRVTAIARDDDGVTVRHATGEVRVSAVVVTVPPPVAAAIVHEPPLPPDRVAEQVGTFMGTVHKAIAVYPEPFWRRGRGGELLSLGEPGCAVFDTSPPDGPGHLCVLVGGPDARALDRLTPEQRRAAVLGPLAAHLGDEVRRPVSYHEKSWHLDEHVGGCYLALPDLRSDAGLAPMPYAAAGRVHWAGSETAHDHPGYLDGAIESGGRAAHEVLVSLGRTDGSRT